MTAGFRSVTLDQLAGARGMGATMCIPSAGALKATGQREMASLTDLLAVAEPGQSVHGARRRIKQLRSLLRLLRPSLGEAAYREADAALSEAADALAGHRRAEALVAAAERLEGAEGPPGFWRRCAEAFRAAHAAEGDPVQSLAAARHAIARAGQRLAAAEIAEDGGAMTGGTFLATYGKARRRLHRAFRSGVPAELHEARKFVIHHLHHMQLLHPEREGRLLSLEALREMLGDLNDLDELEQLAAAADIPPEDARRLHRARRRLLERAGKAAQRLFRRGRHRFGRRLGHAGKSGSPGRAVALETGE